MFSNRGSSIVLGYLSQDDGDRRGTLMNLKSANVSIERTRKDRFRQVLRSVSKVAFSQLGLGKTSIEENKSR